VLFMAEDARALPERPVTCEPSAEGELALKGAPSRWIEYGVRAGVLPGRNLLVVLEVSARKRAHERFSQHKVILERIARGEPLSSLLEALALFIESQSDGVLCSILLFDASAGVLREGAAPSLPVPFRQALAEIPVGPHAGSCGTAAFRRESVITADIETDPLWEGYVLLALENGLRACWSTPILSSHEALLGTFALYAAHPCTPSAEHLELIEVSTKLAALAIERHRGEVALARGEERYRTLFTRNLAGVYRSTLDGRILECNDSFARTLGFDAAEQLIGLQAVQFYLDGEHRVAMIARLREQGSLTNFIQPLKRHDGETIWVLENINYLEGTAGAPDTMMGTLIDISDRKKAEEQLRYMAYYDALTALPNRALFDDRIESCLLQARHSGVALAVLFVDLDRFKVINDSLGHRAGDALLKLVAERLKAAIFDSDTVARRGGDEFLVLLPRLGSSQHVTRVVRKVFSAFEEPFVVDGRDLFVAFSMGISIFPEDGRDAETLVKNAETAMYRAQKLGRDTFQFYAAAMNTTAVERIALETSMHRAVEKGEFVVYYQPLVDMRSGQIDGMEALIRWNHETRGMIGPGEFISLAEETGLIVPIGAWVIRTACLQASEWRERGHRPLRLSVNLSARQFQDPNLVELVEATLQETGLSPSFLEFEITESIAMEDVQESLSTLHRLKALGVRITLDDFGTGHSSLSYLKTFPIDSLKIDRSFIKDIVTNPSDVAIAVASIAFAHGLKLRVIAEGVETQPQLELLRFHACDAIQGFLFSPPIPADDFERLLVA
jgi:diguanylate cyclase (GGDEF)-like protein/PAS domain S-box-containing protein